MPYISRGENIIRTSELQTYFVVKSGVNGAAYRNVAVSRRISGDIVMYYVNSDCVLRMTSAPRRAWNIKRRLEIQVRIYAVGKEP